MKWIEEMNRAIRYIEENLTEEIDYHAVGKLAGCSAYHFQKVFSYMANVTLSEYIRRRRLTLAAFDLQDGNEKVIDIAVKYGYDSPTAFTRAFKQFHGAAPSEAKKDGKPFTSYPPMSFQITIKGVTAMNYRIEKKEAFRVVGVKLRTSMENEEGWTKIPQFWGQCYQNGMVGKIAAMINQEPYGLLGISAGDWQQLEGDWQSQVGFDYYIAASTDQPVSEGMVEYMVPASTWAIFESVGPMPQALQDLQKRIVTEWLPNSGYEYGEGPDIEVYTDGDNTAADYKCYAWLPITKPAE